MLTTWCCVASLAHIRDPRYNNSRSLCKSPCWVLIRALNTRYKIPKCKIQQLWWWLMQVQRVGDQISDACSIVCVPVLWLWYVVGMWRNSSQPTDAAPTTASRPPPSQHQPLSAGAAPLTSNPPHHLLPFPLKQVS